jgi:hypothetical protein
MMGVRRGFDFRETLAKRRRDRTALRAADAAWPGPPRAARSVRRRRAPLPPHRASGRTEVASATVLPAPAGGARIRSWRGRHHVEVAQAVQLFHELAPWHGVVVRVPRGTAHRHKDRRDRTTVGSRLGGWASLPASWARIPTTSASIQAKYRARYWTELVRRRCETAKNDPRRGPACLS